MALTPFAIPTLTGAVRAGDRGSSCCRARSSSEVGVTLASILALGFVLGMRHATDADHLAAVATLATRSRSVGHTVAQGIAWGTGHTLTLMLFGGAVLVLGAVVPARAAQALELAVGVMLVLLGADALYRLRRKRVHFHAHRHADGVAHFHAHSHRGEGAPHDPARHEHMHPRELSGPRPARRHGARHGGLRRADPAQPRGPALARLGARLHRDLRPRLDPRHGSALGRDRGAAAADVAPPRRAPTTGSRRRSASRR